MNKITRNLIFVALLLVAGVSLSEVSNEYTGSKGNRLSDKDAIAKALRYTGFDKWETFSLEKNFKGVEMTILRDTTTPFLTKEMDKRRALDVQFENVVMDLPRSFPGWNAKNPKNFHVYLDAITGQLLKIIGLAPEKSLNDLAPKPPAWCAEKQLLGARQQNLGLVKVFSGVSLREALNVTEANPSAAKEIIAVPVIFVKIVGHDTAAAWDVHLFGVPSTPPQMKAQVPIAQKNHWRTLVRLETGAGWLSCTIPQPGVCEKWETYEPDTLNW